MTDSSPHAQPPRAQAQPLPFIHISRELIEYVRSLKLTGTQYDLWLLLFNLDPYGDRFIEVPNPKDLGNLLMVDYRTIERAAQRLADCNLFESLWVHSPPLGAKHRPGLAPGFIPLISRSNIGKSATAKALHFCQKILSAKGSLCRELIKLHVRNPLRARV